MQFDRHNIFRAFKYTVYVLLVINVYVFFAEEWAASAHRFADGIALSDIIEGFAASIDTAAWVVLLLMFELETDFLPDHHFTRRITFSLHGLRIFCYGFIIYAFYGYLTKLLFLLGASPVPDISNLCSIAGSDWAYAIDLDEYLLIDGENCATFSTANSFIQFTGMSALVDISGYRDIVRLAWVDVINSAVWLLVVLVLEIDVRLQDRNKLTGLALRVSNASKYFLYSLLLLAAIYWGFKGDFVDFWDAFLWLLAFVAIEMNVFEWRQESLQQPLTAPH
jgi:hypothetical protein